MDFRNADSYQSRIGSIPVWGHYDDTHFTCRTGGGTATGGWEKDAPIHVVAKIHEEKFNTLTFHSCDSSHSSVI